MFGVILYFHFTWIAQGKWIVLIDIFLIDCLYELLGLFLCSLLLCNTDILCFSFLVSCTSCMLLRKAPHLVCQVSLTASLRASWFRRPNVTLYAVCLVCSFQTIEQSDKCTQCHGRQHSPFSNPLSESFYLVNTVHLCLSQLVKLANCLLHVGGGAFWEKAVTCFNLQMAYIHICECM